MADFLEIKFDLFDSRPLIPIPGLSAMPERMTLGELYNRSCWTAERRISQPRYAPWLPPSSLDSERLLAQDEELAERSYSGIDRYFDNLLNMSPTSRERHDSQIRAQFSSKRNRPVQNLIEKYDGETCTCSLCLNEITKGSDIYKLPCNHIFHVQNCIGEQNIMAWVKDHGTCPYCRAKTDLSEPKF